MPSPFPPGSSVAVYLRHSPGDLQNLQSQESAVRQWCADAKLSIARVFADEGKSGGSVSGRDSFLSMIHWLTAQDRSPVAGVVLWSYSRFARDYNDAQFYIALLRRHRCEPYSMTDNIPDGDAAPIIESITFWKDAQRRKEIGRDAQRGLQWLAQQGYSVGGFPPMGYRKGEPVEVGRRKNGSARLAHKWEIDEALADRVRLAWRMRLEGKGYWEIHHATRIFKSINCYTTFFSNKTYAGIRKCAALEVPSAHPAYVTPEQFAQVQRSKAPARIAKNPQGDPDHPKRRRMGNPYMLSGILRCGYCGAAMVGDTDRAYLAYRCGCKQRQGREACVQKRHEAGRLHETVCEWLAVNVFTLEVLRHVKAQVNALLSGTRDDLVARRSILVSEREAGARKIANLLDAIEEGGKDVASRLAQRRLEQQRVEADLADVEQLMGREKLEISDGALAVVVEHLAALLRSQTSDAHSLVRAVVNRAELFADRIVLHYSPVAVLAPITGISSMPPRGYIPNTVLASLVGEVTLIPAMRGAGSDKRRRKRELASTSL